MAHTMMLIDLDHPQQPDTGVRPMVTMGKIFCYFEKLSTWLPIVVPITFDAGAWYATVQQIKDTIKSTISAYYDTDIMIHRASGQSKIGNELPNTYKLLISTWLYATDEHADKKATKKDEAASETEKRIKWPPAEVSTIDAHVYLIDKKVWKKVSMPNREGPTQGRCFTSIRMLKFATLRAFGFGSFDEIKVYYREIETEAFKDIQVYYNDGGVTKTNYALRMNERVIHGRWYSIHVDPLLVIDDTSEPVSPEFDMVETWDDLAALAAFEDDLN